MKLKLSKFKQLIQILVAYRGSMAMSTRCCLVAQSCVTACDPMTAAHQSPLSTGFFRLEYRSGLHFPFPNEYLLLLSRFSRFSVTAWDPMTAAHKAPLSTGFSRLEYRSGLPFPSPNEYLALPNSKVFALCLWVSHNLWVLCSWGLSVSKIFLKSW